MHQWLTDVHVVFPDPTVTGFLKGFSDAFLPVFCLPSGICVIYTFLHSAFLQKILVFSSSKRNRPLWYLRAHPIYIVLYQNTAKLSFWLNAGLKWEQLIDL